jgi:hypothetical protein
MRTRTASRRPEVLARSTIVGALLVGAALSGCSATRTSPAAAGQAPRPPAAGRTLFSDSFHDDHNGWALPSNERASSTYERGDFVWLSHSPTLRPHLGPETLGRKFDQGTLRMRNVIVTATFTPERGKGAVGVFCREVRDTDADFQWYEFVARDGYAAIRHADSAGHLVVLSTSTDIHLPLRHDARIQATCQDDRGSHAQLWLRLDGKVVLFARDPVALHSGVPGLQAYDAPATASRQRLLVRWHDFRVQRPG